MTSLVLAGFCALVLVIAWAKRQHSSAPALGFYFSKHLFDTLLPLTAVAWVFAGISLYHRTFRFSTTSLSALVAAEERLSAAAAVVKMLSIPLPVAIALLVVTLFFQLKLAMRARDIEILRSLAEGTSRAGKYVREYGKWMGMATAALAFATSFTLFGRELGPASSALQLRIKELRDGYADFRSDAEEVAATSALTNVLDEAMKSSPPNYQAAISRAVNNSERLVRLIRASRKAALDHGVRLARIQVLEAARPLEGSALESVLEKSSEAPGGSVRTVSASRASVRPDDVHTPPPELSEDMLEIAKRDLAGTVVDLEKRIAAAPWRTHLSAFNSKAIGGALKFQNFEAFAEAGRQFPVLQPLFQLVENIAKDLAVHHTDRRIDTLLARAAMGEAGSGVRGQLEQLLLERVPTEDRRVDGTQAEAAAAETVRMETELEASEQDLKKQVELAEGKLRKLNAQRRSALSARMKGLLSEVAAGSSKARPWGVEWRTTGAPTRADHRRALEAVVAHTNTGTVTEQRDMLDKLHLALDGEGTLLEKERAIAAAIHTNETVVPELARVLPKPKPTLPVESLIAIPSLLSRGGFAHPGMHTPDIGHRPPSYSHTPSYTPPRTYTPPRRFTLRR